MISRICECIGNDGINTTLAAARDAAECVLGLRAAFIECSAQLVMTSHVEHAACQPAAWGSAPAVHRADVPAHRRRSARTTWPHRTGAKIAARAFSKEPDP